MLCRFGSILQRKTGIKIKLSIIIHKNRRIKLEWLPFFSNWSIVFIVYVAVELIMTCRFVTDRNRDHLGSTHKIIKVKTTIRPLHHIRCSEAIGQTDSRCRGILLSLIDTSFIFPVAQVIHRR